MKNKYIKIIAFVSLIIFIMLFGFPIGVQASNDKNNLNGWIDQANNFVNPKNESPVNMNDVGSAVIPIAQALVAIATIILIGVTIFMGIKYVTCQSADQKAKLKTQLIGLGISTIVIFGAQVIWATLYSIMSKV